jgi:hypothetical protein
MNTVLRNLTRRWANRMLVRSNDAMRRELVGVEAAVQRLKQETAILRNTVRSFGQLCEANQQMRRQAEQERDTAIARQTELEQQLVAASEQHGDGWADIVAAGLAAPDVSQP